MAWLRRRTHLSRHHITAGGVAVAGRVYREGGFARRLSVLSSGIQPSVS